MSNIRITDRGVFANADVAYQRTHCDPEVQPPYLLSIYAYFGSGNPANYPLVRANVDDFGNLVPVEAWR